MHWTIRLLVPDGSLLLQRPELTPYLDDYDADLLGWRWHARDPRTDELQQRLAALVEYGNQFDHEPAVVFEAVVEEIEAATSRRLPARTSPTGPGPRLSETWFCCAEPTCDQRLQVAPGPQKVPGPQR